MPTSVLRVVLERMQLTFHATRRTSHGASRLVQAMSAWLVKTRRAPSRYRRGARIYGHTTKAMHKLSIPPPPRASSLLFSCSPLFVACIRYAPWRERRSIRARTCPCLWATPSPSSVLRTPYRHWHWRGWWPRIPLLGRRLCWRFRQEGGSGLLRFEREMERSFVDFQRVIILFSSWFRCAFYRAFYLCSCLGCFLLNFLVCSSCFCILFRGRRTD